MKLLMISGDRSILQGKKGAFWYTLEEFCKHWERVDVICPRVRAKGKGKWEKGQGEDPLPFSLCPFPSVHFHPSPHALWYQSKWIVKKGKELIKGHGHDVMSVHEYPPFYNGIGAEWLSRRMKIPYALEVHHIVGYPRASSFTELLGRILSHLFLPHDAMGAKAVRCVNRQVVDVLDGWGTPREKLYVIPSFYLDKDALSLDSAALFSSEEPGASAEGDESRDGAAPLEKSAHDVVCCGRLVKNKGFADLVRAIASLSDANLLIIGDGPERKKLEKLAAKLKISDRVTFAGWQEEQNDVYQLIKSAKIFVMNSLSEGGPRVALEAMALGLPIITTKVGVMTDVIRDGENGLFTSGKPDDLAAKISKLLDYPALREGMGKRACRILDRFERRELIGKYAEFLKKMANGG